MDKTIITMLTCLMLALFQAPATGKTKVAEETLAVPTTGQPIQTDKALAPSLSKPQPTPVKPAPTLRVKPDKTEISKKTADLAIRSFACSPASINAGASTTLRAVIVNTGTALADGVSIVFLLNGKKIDEKQKLQIKPKQSIQVSASYRPEQTGRLSFQARIESRATGTKIGRASRTAETTLLVNAALMVRPSLSAKSQDIVSPVKPGSRLSAAPSAVQRTIQRPSPPTDLAVEQLRYHEDLSDVARGTLHGTKPGISFIVRNTGTTRIDPEQFRRSQIKIVIDRKSLPGSSRLGQLVSYERISKPGSRATVAIPIELPDRVPVAVTINSNNSIFELNTANNATSALLGGAPAGPQRIGGDGSKTESIAADRGQLPGLGKPGRSDIRDQISAPGTKPGTAPLGDRQMSLSRPVTGTQQSIGDVTPKLLDRGIEIISPNFEDVYSPSSLIPIRYRFSRPLAAGGTIVFTAVGGGEVVATETIRNDNPPGPTDPHRQVQLQLPGGIDAGLYLIGARHEASGAVGLSDAFRVISLHAEEIEGSEEEIGDAGGFGGDGTEPLPFFEPMQAYPVGGGDSIGDGGGFGGPGIPTLTLSGPRSGHHVSERDMAYGAEVWVDIHWQYYGPLDMAPEHWPMELINTNTNEVVRAANLSCLDRVDMPASASQSLPSRSCRSVYADNTLNGNFRLRLSGGGLTAESGIIHWGVDIDRPLINFGHVGPVYLQGDPIPVVFSFRPARSDIVIELWRDREREYAHIVPRLSCGIMDDSDINGYGLSDVCHHTIETDTLPVGINNYRVVVRSLVNSGVSRSSDRFSIQELPFAETDDNAVDFRLTGLQVSPEGHLQVQTSIVAPALGGKDRERFLPTSLVSYNLAFMVGRDDQPGFRRVERSVSTSGGWVSLGHIDSYTSPTDRRSHDRLRFNVLVNQPVEIVERTYHNNSISEGVFIRSSYAYCNLRNAPGETYFRDGVLRYEVDPQWPSDTLTGLDLVCFSRGYANVTGTVEVRQIRAVPGEMRTETVFLGSRRLLVETTDVYRMEPQDPHTRVNLFESGITYPRPGSGQLRIFFRGPLYFNGDYRQEITVDFRLR